MCNCGHVCECFNIYYTIGGLGKVDYLATAGKDCLAGQRVSNNLDTLWYRRACGSGSVNQRNMGYILWFSIYLLYFLASSYHVFGNVTRGEYLRIFSYGDIFSYLWHHYMCVFVWGINTFPVAVYSCLGIYYEGEKIYHGTLHSHTFY